ncbi:MAG: N,N'-diacetylchitobiose phosphorylase [Oscillospiraceae bacterium]|jgi:cellobiose phosphorylase|nr:N,N'-diacetylchitobiose phosphorylase [Oscillospiraceae bacterium]
MNYGYFDESKKEYVITNPATPAPWANYLGDPNYGAIISNNAGGYSFVKSGAKGRILRYRFNDNDDPGRYIYIRDEADGDFWSASWQPVGKPLDEYKSKCCHGTAYTAISAEYKGISSEALYYVPLGATYEVWRLKLTNDSDKPRKLGIFGYAEFTTDNNYEQDQVNLQYTQFITRTYFVDDSFISMTINENCKEEFNGNKRANRFFGLCGSPVASYNGDKEAFLGLYNGYAKPQALKDGKCNNVLNYNLNPCGALHSYVELAAGETKEICFVLGQKEDDGARAIMTHYSDVKSAVDAEIAELSGYWHSKLDNFQVNTPDDKFNAMINTWNAFQCFITFVWSRAASFSYCGQRNGFGYRDTVQDIQGIIHLDPAMAKKQIEFMLSAQVHHGGGLPLVKYSHNPGHEDSPEDESYVAETGHPAYRADDAMWLFPTVKKYIDETGDIAFLDKVIPYATHDEGTVYDHLKRAIDFSMNRLAAHGMPAGLHADWNDCLRMGSQGESTFVAMQLYLAMNILQNYAEGKGDADYTAYLAEKKAALYDTIQTNCWEGDRFVRGIRDNGVVVGSKNDKEASMWLNPQSWSVISGLASKEQAEKALQTVYEQLNTPYGARVLAPSYKDHAFDGSVMILFNGSTKENGGIFSQPQGWIILAEALMGHGNRAFEYFKESSPAYMNDKAEIRKLEPYAHGQFTESVDSPFEGRSHVHWLTGTASTVMVGCVEGICGIRPCVDGIVISPSVPSDWKNFTMKKTFRGKKLNISVENPNGAESGISEVYLNGKLLDGTLIKESDMTDENEIRIVM